MQEIAADIKVIAFDADDTLWDNEPFFRQAEEDMCEILSPYGSKEDVAAQLFKIEMGNMEDYGYGAIAFTMSLIENAIHVSNGQVSAHDIARIIASGKTLMHLKATPLDGVVETLQSLKINGRCRLVVFTKGELITQENKLNRSGLLPLFDKVFIVSDKKEQQYQNLCTDLNIEPEQLLMVGNSLKSDILPALNIGAWAVHIPYEIMWQHEIIESFEHQRMRTIDRFAQILDVLPKNLTV